jgi:transposase
MKEVRQTEMPELSQVKPAEVTERRTGERSEPGRSGVTSAGVNRQGPLPVSVPNPEVLEKPLRRRFTAEYKLRILKEVDALTDSGQIGALLRREGLYSSHLTTWRRQREAGTIQALQPQKRGRRGRRRDPVIQENEQLRRENDRLVRRLQKAETIIEIQKKISELLGIPLSPTESGEDD